MPNVPTCPPGREPPPGEATRKLPSPEAVIRDGVITSLGLPPGLYRVAVLPLWPGHYRVNVLTGEGATSARVAHSYFVEAAADGAIATATPRITRLYA